MDDHNLSLADYIKKKYNFNEFPEIVEIFFLGLIASIIIYFFIFFRSDILYIAVVVTGILIIIVYFLNKKYKSEYDSKIEYISTKLLEVKKQLKKLSKKK